MPKMVILRDLLDLRDLDLLWPSLGFPGLLWALLGLTGPYLGFTVPYLCLNQPYLGLTLPCFALLRFSGPYFAYWAIPYQAFFVFVGNSGVIFRPKGLQ